MDIDTGHESSTENTGSERLIAEEAAKKLINGYLLDTPGIQISIKDFKALKDVDKQSKTREYWQIAAKAAENGHVGGVAEILSIFEGAGNSIDLETGLTLLSFAEGNLLGHHIDHFLSLNNDMNSSPKQMERYQPSLDDAITKIKTTQRQLNALNMASVRLQLSKEAK